MAKKVLLLVAVVCMLVPFMVLGSTASAETYNSTIRITGIDLSQIADFVIFVYSPTEGAESYSYDNGDFSVVAENVLEVSFEIDLLTSNLRVCFGVDTLDSSLTYVFKGLRIQYLPNGEFESYPIATGSVNMFTLYPLPDDFYVLECVFAPVDARANAELYQDGYDAGYSYATNNVDKNSASYYQGLIDGRAEAGDYTFLGLIGAVIDAPINALFGHTTADGVFHPGLFSIEILGMNMSAFILSIFTLGLIIAILRLCLGGK